MSDWHPVASIESLRQRARVLAQIRRFFDARDVIEVETPLLAVDTVSDVHLQSFSTTLSTGSEPLTLYLQTSPEYAMKRLLAAGMGACYQVCKSFREDLPGRLHNPEFTMLEWYRPGFSLEDLMDEVEALVTETVAGNQEIGSNPHPFLSSTASGIERISYREAFLKVLGLDPHTAQPDRLSKLANERLDIQAAGLSATDYLQLLMAEVVEPQLPDNFFLYDYPVGQAALARVEEDATGQLVARRFELFCAGMELANGYHELSDAEEQRRRFRADRARRQKLDLPVVEIDEQLLAALEHGLPDCSGVALGVDRLVMLALGKQGIDQVMSFSFKPG